MGCDINEVAVSEVGAYQGEDAVADMLAGRDEVAIANPEKFSRVDERNLDLKKIEIK